MQDDAADRLTRLYREHSPRVLGFALNRGAGDAAGDVLSETFAVAWRRLDDVPDPALPWLLGVARNVLAHHWRAQGRRNALQDEVARLGAGRGDHGPDIADTVVERASVLRALETLSDDDREVLVLTGWDGLSTTDAAAVLGCAPGTLSVRLHRARRRLQSALGPPPSCSHAHPIDDRAVRTTGPAAASWES